MNSKAQLPQSVSKWADPFVLCAVILSVYWNFSRLAISDLGLSILIVAASIAVMAALEWWRVPKHTIGYSLREIFSHSVVTWIGTLAGLAIVFLAWNTLALYQNSYYVPFFQALPLILFATPILSAFFIIAADRILGPSKQGGYQLGLVTLGRFKEVDWTAVRDNLITWFIRGFFLPINFCELVRVITLVRGHEFSLLQGSLASSEYYLLVMIYGLIIAAVVPGYIFGARLIRTENKSVSHSWFGWTVTLACYPPFEYAFFTSWFDYSPTTADPIWLQPWAQQLQNLPAALAIVGVVILFFSLIHLWGEAQFGLRSSNLTNRGIITTGPYRFCKHPVYLAKCIVWFLVSIPFVSGMSIFDDLRLTVLWICVCGIFTLRTVAEEQLLSRDPDYVAYARWIEEHGVLSFLKKIPAFSYEWRLARWQQQHPDLHSAS